MCDDVIRYYNYYGPQIKVYDDVMRYYKYYGPQRMMHGGVGLMRY